MKIKNCCYISILWITFFLSCTKSCNKNEEPALKNNQELETAKEIKEEFKDLANIDYINLTVAQKNSINKFFNDEVCPCECEATFYECLADSSCPAAKILAQWSVEQLSNQAPERSLFKVVSEEINSGFKAEKQVIDTKHGYHKGKKNASITVVEFADFECPACKVVSKELRSFYEENKNDIEIYFMHFPLKGHENAELAAIASEAAQKVNGKFWPMHDLLFDYEGILKENDIKSLASSLFSPKEFKNFENLLKDKSLQEKISQQKEYAVKDLGLMATPSVFFNNRPYKLPPFRDALKIRLEMEKVRDKASCKK